MCSALTPRVSARHTLWRALHRLDSAVPLKPTSTHTQIVAPVSDVALTPASASQGAPTGAVPPHHHPAVLTKDYFHRFGGGKYNLTRSHSSDAARTFVRSALTDMFQDASASIKGFGRIGATAHMVSSNGHRMDRELFQVASRIHNNLLLTSEADEAAFYKEVLRDTRKRITGKAKRTRRTEGRDLDTKQRRKIGKSNVMGDADTMMAFDLPRPF